MNKLLLAGILLTTYGTTLAQTPEDALRYSWLQNSGTARSQGIANANGAIGGEISTIFSNPANIGFYKTGDFVVSGGFNIVNNNTGFYGESNSSNRTTGFLGTSGIVLGKQSYGKGSLKSSAFGFAVNRTADFNNRISYKGLNNDGTSMADYFIEDVKKFGSTNPHGSELAYKTYWVDEDANGNLVSPASTVARNGGLEQMQTINTYGGITEIAIAGAGNINDKVYFGGAIGLPILRYGATREYVEQDPNANNSANGFDVAYFDDDLITKGVGVNVKAGVVVKATENLRLGFAAHSPTFYSMSDSYIASAGTSLENYPVGNDYQDEANSDELVYDYNLQTPYKLAGSFALMFGNVNDVASQKGFVSGDVEYVNYMASTFRTTNNDGGSNNGYFRDLNGAIDNAYKGAVNARLGAELKFNPIMVRFGGAYYGNPYQNIAGEKGELIQATGGLGYRNKGFFIDLGYVHNIGKDVVFPYRLTNAAFQPATIKSSSPRVLLTLGFKI